MNPPNGRTGCYLYGVTRGDVSEGLVAVGGVAGARVRMIQDLGLTAIISDVDLEEFGDEGLRRHLEDLRWVEAVARRHDAVVRAAAEVAPVAPVRLATICHDEDGVRERLAEWHDPLHRALDRLVGRMEWSVKAFAPDRVAEPPVVAASQSSDVGVGAAYLRRRQAEHNQRRRAGAEAGELADDLHALLSGESAASRRLAPQDRRLSGHDGTMTLNGAYLVDASAAQAFCAAAQRWGDAHPESRISVQGPWPPYSFATLDEP